MSEKDTTKLIDKTCKILIDKADELDGIALGEVSGNEIADILAVKKTNLEIPELQTPYSKMEKLTDEEWDNISLKRDKIERNLIHTFETRVGTRKKMILNSKNCSGGMLKKMFSKRWEKVSYCDR